MESNVIHTCDPTLTFPIPDLELDLLIILISACLNNSTIKEYYNIKIIITCNNQIKLIQYTHSHTCTCIYNQVIQYTQEYIYVHVHVCTCMCACTRVGSSYIKKSLSTSSSPSNFLKLKLKPQPI